MDGHEPVQCACGARELAYVNATFVENNVVHRSDKCEDLDTDAEWPGDVPESVTVTYERYEDAPAPTVRVPLAVLDEAYLILASWSEVGTVPEAWRGRMRAACLSLYQHGAGHD